MCAFSSKELNRRVEKVLENLDRYAHCGGVFHEISGSFNPLAGKALCRLCNACVFHFRAGNLCRQAAISAAYRSITTGEAFQFNCWLGLNAIVFPVSPDANNLLGCIEIGGIFMHGEFQKRQHQILSILSSVGADDDLQQFINAFQGIDETPEINIKHLSSFIEETLFSSGLLNHGIFLSKRALWAQQKRIADGISDLELPKKEGYSEEIVKCLTRLLKIHKDAGKKENIIETSDKLISLLSLECANDLNRFKAYSLVIVSIITVSNIFKGQNWAGNFSYHTLMVEEINKFDDIPALCFWLEKLICRFNDDLVDHTDEKLSLKILNYVHKHYHEKLKIDTIAREVGASSSSVMHKIKDETGMTFTETLNAIRIKEAKRLLAFTSLSLGEISSRCGFRDQSYFTKIFRKNINICPRDFRNMLNENKLS